MAKRIFAALSSILVGFSGTSDAQIRPVAVDGCALLARVVYTEVSSAALYGPGNSGPWIINGGQGDIAVCEHAGETVSRAFTSAMMSVGITVDWPRNGITYGDVCESHYLSQCYPSLDRRPGTMSATQLQRVQKSWSIVSRSVLQEMYNPHSSDEVRFREEDLKLRIGLSLRTVRPMHELAIDTRE